MLVCRNQVRAELPECHIAAAALPPPRRRRHAAVVVCYSRCAAAPPSLRTAAAFPTAAAKLSQPHHRHRRRRPYGFVSINLHGRDYDESCKHVAPGEDHREELESMQTQRHHL